MITFTTPTTKAFTLLELLVVIAIIGLLSSVVLASVNDVREKSRDARRLSDMRQLQTALEFYYDSNGSYPTTGGAMGDCSGNSSFATALQPLVDAGYMSKIPNDPQVPSNPWPQCYYYISNRACYNGDDVHPYVLLFRTEEKQLNYSSWYGAVNRWCLHP